MNRLLSSDERLLHIKSLNGKDIFTKFKENHTIADVINTLIKKVKFAVYNNDGTTNKFYLKNNNRLCKDSDLVSKYYNPKDECASLRITLQSYIPEPTNYGDHDTIILDVLKRMHSYISLDLNLKRRKDLVKWAKLNRHLGVNGRSKNADILKSIHLHSNRPAQIFVKTLSGQTLTLTVPQNLTGLELRHIIFHKSGTPVDQQRIILCGRQPRDCKPICTEESLNEKTFHLVLRLRGGMYDERSGRNGSYEPLNNILDTIFAIEEKNNDIKEEIYLHTIEKC